MSDPRSNETKSAALDYSLADSPFTTASDVLRSLNTALAETGHDSDPLRPSFQLQKRFEDGSTRPATVEERKAADLDSKLKQVANHVASLKTLDERLEFIEGQRQYGNHLYSESRFEEAIDVYLTCLTVAKESDALFLKVMNNLAQASLQLQWYLKTEKFVTLALEHLHLTTESETGDEHRQAVAKLFFRRGKARRLRGDYTEAKADLMAAQRWMDEPDSAEHRSIDKELRLLAQSVQEGRKNLQRAQRAMKTVLQPMTKPAEAGTTLTSTVSSDSTATKTVNESKPLYPERRAGGRRTYSSLRAPSDKEAEEVGEEEEPLELTYWQHYMLVVGKIAELLLQWIGDEAYSSRKQD